MLTLTPDLAFINYWSEKRLAAEGKSFYARLHSGLLISGQWPPERHIINWIRIKASLDDLVTRYPDKYNRNLQASFACAFGDKDYFNQSVSTLAETDFTPAAWRRGDDIRKCSNYLNK
jgi:hypothetical protein